jgi:hypothetical protein
MIRKQSPGKSLEWGIQGFTDIDLPCLDHFPPGRNTKRKWSQDDDLPKWALKVNFLQY